MSERTTSVAIEPGTSFPVAQATGGPGTKVADAHSNRRTIICSNGHATAIIFLSLQNVVNVEQGLGIWLNPGEIWQNDIYKGTVYAGATVAAATLCVAEV